MMFMYVRLCHHLTMDESGSSRVVMFGSTAPPLRQLICHWGGLFSFSPRLVQNLCWESKENKAEPTCQSLSASWDDRFCFWIREQEVLHRVAVTFQALAFITCLDLRFSDLSLLMCALRSVFCPPTVQSLTNLTGISGNLCSFFCFLSTYFQTSAYTKQNS